MSVASQVGQTLANLQNAQATLEIYAIQSAEEESRAVFREAAEVTARMVAEVAEDLKRLECVNARVNAAVELSGELSLDPAADPSGREPAAEGEPSGGLS